MILSKFNYLLHLTLAATVNNSAERTMTTSSFYKSLAEKENVNDRGFTGFVNRIDPMDHNHVRSTNRVIVSDLWRLHKAPYRKVVHVNGDTAALVFYIQDSTGRWLPWTGTEYKPCGFTTFPKLPGFIKRHIDADILQDYANQRAMGNYKKYPMGLHFENGELVQL